MPQLIAKEALWGIDNWAFGVKGSERDLFGRKDESDRIEMMMEKRTET